MDGALTTAINSYDAAEDVDVLLSVAPSFRLRDDHAQHILRIVAGAFDMTPREQPCGALSIMSPRDRNSCCLAARY
jgi:hypothetical protein